MHYNLSVLLALKKQRIWYVNGFKRCIITFRYYCIEKQRIWYMNGFKRCIKPFGTISIEKYEYDIWMDLKDAS